jgi:hypothetical protein
VNARRTDETSTRADETSAHAEETGAHAEETGVHAAETSAHADEAARRSRAAGIVATVAERLSDPETVAAVMARDPRTNHAASLANGFPSVALLFAELGTTDPGHRHTAHTMLERAVKEPGDGDVSLHSGLASLAFAARANARDTGDYGTLLGQLDDHLSEAARLLSAPTNVRGWRHDVITGLAGLGRYLLMSPATPPDAMRAILRHLVALTDPVEVEGIEVPGWWVMALPWTSMSEDTAERYRHGHGNLGISHGIPGPLALLALSWKAGLTVPGQREAMEGIVEWLLGWSSSDEHGIRWPTTVTMDQHRDRAAGHAGHPGHAGTVASWCYGLPGIGRAIQLAGVALDRPDWTRVADQAMASLLGRPARQLQLRSAALCHGWAGLLQVAMRIDADSPDRGGPAARVAELAAERTLRFFDSGAAFGYRFPISGVLQEGPGLLEGAAGVALALHGYATGQAPRTGWDAALLIA